VKGQILYPEESYAIVGACFNVYNEMGCGFLEDVYQECLEIEFEGQRIPFVAQKEFKLAYRGRTLRKTFKADFLCHEKIILELKAVSALADEHRAQLLNHLSTSGCKLGMLVNFGHYPRLEYERLVLTDDNKPPRLARLGDDNQWRPVDWKNNSCPFV